MTTKGNQLTSRQETDRCPLRQAKQTTPQEFKLTAFTVVCKYNTAIYFVYDLRRRVCLWALIGKVHLFTREWWEVSSTHTKNKLSSLPATCCILDAVSRLSSNLKDRVKHHQHYTQHSSVHTVNNRYNSLCTHTWHRQKNRVVTSLKLNNLISCSVTACGYGTVLSCLLHKNDMKKTSYNNIHTEHQHLFFYWQPPPPPTKQKQEKVWTVTASTDS